MADTVLITGASGGLGEGFARAFAARGADVILVARRTDRLAALTRDLAAAHGIAAHPITADLTAPDAAATLFAEIAARGLTVTHLVNNAGFGLRGAFAELDGAAQARMIDLNCRTLVTLARAALPGMLAGKRGGILNVASTASFQPGPWMTVYYATKAFVLSFSEGLHEEVRGSGVHVAALCPGPTRTEFAAVADMADSALFQRFAVDPAQVVRDGVAALDANRAVKVSGAANALMAGAIRFTPRGVARRMAAGLQKRR